MGKTMPFLREPQFYRPILGDREPLLRYSDPNSLEYDYCEGCNIRVFEKCCECGDKKGFCGWCTLCWPRGNLLITLTPPGARSLKRETLPFFFSNFLKSKKGKVNYF